MPGCWRKIPISLIDPEGDPHSFHGFSQFQRRYATSLSKRESESMREHTHLPAMVGFVRKHVAQHMARLKRLRKQCFPVAAFPQRLEAAFKTMQLSQR
jgi:DNA-binding MurR/RpiR family transcriptional regulator